MNHTIHTRPTPRRSILLTSFRELGLLTVGGAAYYFLEVLCRGYSHWTMALCGGVCLNGIFHANRAMKDKPLLLRAMVCGLLITAVELACGSLVNLKFHKKVWDYSDLPLNLWGQICLPFTLLWIALSLPICAVFSLLEKN